jgi:hypothetical protein
VTDDDAYPAFSSSDANAGTPQVNLGGMDDLLREHTAGEHKIPHPDCGGCKAAKMVARGTYPWGEPIT